jgi:hypothetical protein
MNGGRKAMFRETAERLSKQFAGGHKRIILFLEAVL